MARHEIQEKVAIFPASFDPLTNGHLDVVERALGIFDRLVLAVAVNLEKESTFSKDERIAMLRSVFGAEPRIEVTAFDSLTVDFAMQIGAKVIIRGLRAMSDFEYEFEMALMNKHLYPEVETVFMMSSQKYLYVSSSRLKELVRMGRSVDAFVPEIVAKKLQEKLGRPARA
jgi:pantetheine-phosphate adenylyltransferase